MSGLQKIRRPNRGVGMKGTGARWPSGLGSWLRMATGHSRPGSTPTAGDFGNSVNPSLPVSFG